MGNTKVYEFDPQVYPFRLWVAVKIPFEELDKFYCYLSNSEVKEFSEKDIWKHSRSRATCWPVVRKDDNRIGILCSIWRTRGMTVGDITHESLHITDFLCGYLGVKAEGFDDGEPRAYFAGWVANCIDQVRRGKI